MDRVNVLALIRKLKKLLGLDRRGIRVEPPLLMVTASTGPQAHPDFRGNRSPQKKKNIYIYTYKFLANSIGYIINIVIHYFMDS